jgi:hypothetical protein
MTPAIRRRLLVFVPLLAAIGGLPGCETPSPITSPPIAGEQNVVIRDTATPWPEPVISSIAAFATVQVVGVTTREVVAQPRKGGIFGLHAPPEFRNISQLRPGMRVAVEYDATGTVRLSLPPRAADMTFFGRARGTIEAVEIGGQRLTVVFTDGLPRTLLVPEQAMMAFVTRLAPGDEVAVTMRDP